MRLGWRKKNDWNFGDAWGEGLNRSCGFGPSVGSVGRCLRWPTRSRLRWCAPIRPIRSSMRSARRCASTDENVPQALSGYRPKVAVTASAGVQYTDTLSTAGGTRPTLVRSHHPRHQRAAQRRHHRDADAVQRPADRQQDPRGGEPGVGGARGLARARADRAALGRHRSTWTICATPRSSRCSSSNVRVLEQTLKQTRDRFNVGEVTRTDVAQSEAQLAAGRTQLLTAEFNLDDHARQLPPHHRQRAGGAGAGLAGRPLSAADAGGRRRTRADRESERHRGDVRHRRQLSPGQGQRRRAVPDRDAAGFGAPDLRNDR